MTSPRPEPQEPPRVPLTAGSRLRPLVTDQSIARWLLVVVIVASVYFFHGFLIPLLAATIIAIASWPLRRYLVRQLDLGRNVAAGLLILLLLVLLIVPLSYALIYAGRELHVWFNWALQLNQTGSPTPQWITAIPRAGSWLDEQWQRFIGHPGAIGELVQTVSGSNIANLYRGAISASSMAFHLALNVLFTLVALFVFYRDGEAIVAQIDRVGTRILPDRWERLSRVVPAMISATVTGMTLIAIAEGFILGTAYWLAGVPSPVVFGVITGFMALIPGGAPLCFTLLSGYLALSGSMVPAAALFIWGTTELFIVDKTIRPLLVGGPVKLPFLATFFGLVGGVKTMGIVGLFVGPVLMALLVAIWREWQREIAMRGKT